MIFSRERREVGTNQDNFRKIDEERKVVEEEGQKLSKRKPSKLEGRTQGRDKNNGDED